MFWSTAKYWRAWFFSLLFSQMEREELWAQKANVRGQEWNEFNIYETNEQNQRHQQFHSRTSNLRIKCVTTSFSRLLNMGKCVVRARPPIYRKLYKNGTVLWAETHTHTHIGRVKRYLSLWCIFHFAVWLRISLTHHLFLIIIIVAHFFSSFYFFHIYILLVELVAIVLYLRLYLYCFRTNHSISRKRPRRNGKKSGKNKNFAFVCACACVVVCKYII